MKRLLLGLMVIGLVFPMVCSAETYFEKTGGGTVISDYTSTWTPTINGKAEIQSVLVKFSAATDEQITVSLDSGNGATYDTVLAVGGTSSKTSFLWQPDNYFIIERDDDINVTVATGSGGETFSILIKGVYK